MGQNLILKYIHVKTYKEEIYRPLLSYLVRETSLAQKKNYTEIFIIICN